MLTLGAVASTWTSNAKLLQRELCVQNQSQTWFAARVTDYTCLTIGTRNTRSLVFGSPTRSLARPPQAQPPADTIHNGVSWCVEQPTTYFLPRRDVTLPRPIDTRAANVLLLQVLQELKVPPAPVEPLPIAAESLVGAEAMFPPMSMMDGEPASPPGEGGFLGGSFASRAGLLFQPDRRALPPRPSMKLIPGTNHLEQASGAHLPMDTEALHPPLDSGPEL